VEGFGGLGGARDFEFADGEREGEPRGDHRRWPLVKKRTIISQEY